MNRGETVFKPVETISPLKHGISRILITVHHLKLRPPLCDRKMHVVDPYGGFDIGWSQRRVPEISIRLGEAINSTNKLSICTMVYVVQTIQRFGEYFELNDND